MPKEHGSKIIAELFQELRLLGFTISTPTKRGTIKITPPTAIEGPAYFTHGTESAFHQLRRDIARLYGIEVMTKGRRRSASPAR